MDDPTFVVNRDAMRSVLFDGWPAPVIAILMSAMLPWTLLWVATTPL